MKGYYEESKHEFKEYKFLGLSELLSHVSREFQDMIMWLLTYDPDLRPSAATTLKHPFFNEIHFTKISTQSRAPITTKVKTKPIIPENEQGGIRRTLDNTKEENKGEKTYSLERNKVNKERASSKLLKSIQK
jgi:serine/threonine protein kinase